MRTIVLVGAGHAHLHIIRAWSREPIPNWRLVVLSSSSYQYYSGMFSGYAEGLYNEKETRVPLVPFCRIAGALFYEETVKKIDAASQTLYCASGKSYSYDLVSFDIGSRIDIPRNFEEISPQVKPADKMIEAIESIRTTEHPVVIGGGAAAVEMALSIHEWRKNNGYSNPVQLISKSALLSETNDQHSVRDELRAAGVHLKEQDSPSSLHETMLTTASGNMYPCTSMFWLTGASSFSLFAESGLVTEEGFLVVTPTLQAAEQPLIFAAGDCAHFGEGIAKNGVHAVKQGPILWYNLQAIILNQKLRAYEPKSNQLSILSLGNRRALALYGNKSFKGKLAWKLKNRIDQNFMRKYRL